MATTTPLLDRIRSAEARQAEANRAFLDRHSARPVPRPRWLDRLQTRDETATVYSAGAFVPSASEPGA